MSNNSGTHAFLLAASKASAIYAHADNADTANKSNPHNGYSTGIGDLNLFNIFLLKSDGVQLGIGPQITAPTADPDELGTDKPPFTLFAGINVTFGK